MDKIWHRGIIKYSQKEGLTPTKIHADMIDTLGDDAADLLTMQNWMAEFKREQKNHYEATSINSHIRFSYLETISFTLQVSQQKLLNMKRINWI